MTELLKRFIVPVLFLVVFVVTISALQTHKTLRENRAQLSLTQAIDLLEQRDVEEIAQRLDGHYWDQDNKAQNQTRLQDFKEKLRQAGKPLRREKPIFSLRSERIPARGDAQSEIYIVHALYENGEMIYTLGLFSDSEENSALWKIDRLSVDYIGQAPADGETEKSEFKLSLLCSKEKGIEKKCQNA